MASLGHGSMEISFSPQARRLLERTTKALEGMAREQKRATVVSRRHDIEIYRDAVSGNYVTKEYAEANPDTTVKENVPAERFVKERPTLRTMSRGANTAAEDLDLDDKDWRTAVGETLGYVSVCWENMEGAGTFDSTRATEAFEALITRLEREMP